MDRWAWAHLDPWLEIRTTLPAGALFCILRGPSCGQPCSPAGIRCQLRHASQQAGVRRRFAPHQLRHAHAVEMSREGISLIVIQRQLGHADLAITSRYLRGIDNTELSECRCYLDRGCDALPEAACCLALVGITCSWRDCGHGGAASRASGGRPQPIPSRRVPGLGAGVRESVSVAGGRRAGRSR